ncbi:MAG: hypothetical protein Pars2KO_13870 [Parasphingorhabdus sp.]
MSNNLKPICKAGFSLLLVGILAGFSFPASATKDPVKDPETSTSSEYDINDRRHPDYVRCRNYSVIGSLAKKRRVCMTNKEWVVYIREGNRRSRQMMEDGQARATDELDPRLEIDKFGRP